MSDFQTKPLNQFSSDPQAGILKVFYQESPLSAALKRKRERLATGKGMEVKDEEGDPKRERE